MNSNAVVSGKPHIRFIDCKADLLALMVAGYVAWNSWVNFPESQTAVPAPPATPANKAKHPHRFNINIPDGMPSDQEITLYGGGALIFDEYARLKYHVRNRILNSVRQTPRLKYLWRYGYFDDKSPTENIFAQLHLQRALNLKSYSAEEF